MLKIDNDFLRRVGLAELPEADKELMRKHIYETLEARVGIRLASRMSNQQLDEFEVQMQSSEAAALEWLKDNLPDYQDVVKDEMAKLEGEIREEAPEILADTAADG